MTRDFATPALEAANLGLRVFPCRPGSKRPAIREWPRRATTDPDEILGFAQEFRGANIGAATADHFVLDVDGPEGAEALASLDIELPATAKVRTKRGVHYLYRGRIPHGCRKVLGCGLDVKGNKAGRATGFTLIPSSSVDGHEYEWANAEPIAPAPAALIEVVQAKPQDKDLVSDRPIYQGERNVTLTRIAGKLYRAGIRDEAGLRGALGAANLSRCRPSLSDREVGHIAASAVRTFEAPPPWFAESPLQVDEWCADPRLSGPEISILRVLANHADADGRCWPSLDRLARLTGIHRNTVRRGLKRLTEFGRISITPRQRKSHVYTLSVSPLPQNIGSSGTRGIPPYTERGNA